jgi:hypothetical protein
MGGGESQVFLPALPLRAWALPLETRYDRISRPGMSFSGPLD